MGKQIKNLYWGRAISPSGSHTHEVPDDLIYTDKRHIMERQFISFSYNGRDIEEFDLIVTMASDGLQDNLYAGFEGRIKEFTELDGQQYYITKYNPKTLTFSLVSDGMTEKQLSEFIHHFTPDKVGKLVLSQHSYRYGEARLSDVPSINMTPYEKKIKVKVGDKEIETSTTEYKGKINVNFVLDKPFWRAKCNVIDMSIMEDDNDIKEAAKAIYEDGILEKSMLTSIKGNELIYGNGYKFNTVAERYEENPIGIPFYYCGTAYTYPIISFKQKILYDNVTSKIISPRSIKTVKEAKDFEDFYSFIKIMRDDNTECELKYTLPGTLMSYNTAIDIMNNSISFSYDSLLQEIKEKITDYNIRNILIQLLESKNENGFFSFEARNEIIKMLKNVFSEYFTVSINCETGVCRFKCGMRSVKQINDLLNGEIEEEPSETEDYLDYTSGIINSGNLTTTVNVDMDRKILAALCLNEKNEVVYSDVTFGVGFVDFKLDRIYNEDVTCMVFYEALDEKEEDYTGYERQVDMPCGDMLVSRYLKINGRDIEAIEDGILNPSKCRKLVTSDALKDFSMSYNYQYL